MNPGERATEPFPQGPGTRYEGRVPAPLGPLLGFCIGALLAWSVRNQRPREELGSGRALLLAAAFSVLVFGPVCAYFLVYAPDWCFAYLIDTARLPRGFEIALTLANVVSVPAGFTALDRMPRERAFAALGILTGPPIFACAAFVAGAASRLSVYGTYAGFHGDFGVVGVAGSMLGYGLLFMALVLGLALAWTLFVLRRLDLGGA